MAKGSGHKSLSRFSAGEPENDVPRVSGEGVDGKVKDESRAGTGGRDYLRKP